MSGGWDLDYRGGTLRPLLVSGETGAARIEGISIRGGRQPPEHWNSNAGAILCDNGASPTIEHCTFVDNRTRYYGGAVYCDHMAAPFFADCLFTDNHAIFGGAIAATGGSSLTIVGCTIIDNGVFDMAGGGAGGGVFVADGSLQIDQCLISDNHGGGNLVSVGGGVALRDCDASITNSIITLNSTDNAGGGVAVWGLTELMMSGCLIADCYTYVEGGGLQCQGGASVTLESCTLSRNQAYFGGGIHGRASTSIHVIRSIVWQNETWEQGPEAWIDGQMTFACSAVDPAGLEGGGSYVFEGENIFEDPLFCQPEPDGDFRIQEDSPCTPANSPAGCDLIGALPVGCGPTPIEPTTWGALKARFAED